MKFRRFSAFALALLLAVLCAASGRGRSRRPDPGDERHNILFTHDLHSHFLPQPTAEGGESGGYARLKTVIDRENGRPIRMPCWWTAATFPSAP